jgi:UDP-3-O-[3-hydroxymyristoyl] glucosamine N-acyltransferase
VVIGADGFGYRPAPDGRGLAHIPHVGTVEIGDFVDVGANSCIDRAKFGATTIGSGTKIDNLVQIAHNCRIGRSCILCGQVGLAGSVVLGDGVVLGGAASVADHLTLGAGVRIAARSGVMNDIPAGETWVGLPAAPAGESMRNYAAFRRLGEMAQKLKRYEKMLNPK